uniref:Putative mitochondrial protein n=1 Tax=Tanacetum cinerariifolium TaxID=118510 RepID=A0A6L2LYP7_TANCI|nr:putative mitochondrial protein [Tanacetum cinerariifolium]
MTTRTTSKWFLISFQSAALERHSLGHPPNTRNTLLNFDTLERNVIGGNYEAYSRDYDELPTKELVKQCFLTIGYGGLVEATDTLKKSDGPNYSMLRGQNCKQPLAKLFLRVTDSTAEADPKKSAPKDSLSQQQDNDEKGFGSTQRTGDVKNLQNTAFSFSSSWSLLSKWHHDYTTESDAAPLRRKRGRFLPPKMPVPPSRPSKQHNYVPERSFILATVVYGSKRLVPSGTNPLHH